jgi:RNA polymerase-binding transcription factor DksA
MEQFDDLKQKLTERKAKLEDLLNRVEKSARRQLDKSYEEQAIQRENEEVLTSLDNSLNQEYEDIEKALFRLENGTYGICENCGGKIASARLEALPHTNLCINCAT